ncbi:MAG: nicotinate-nucleotide adenylyltransferase [Pyrinomonadaceae bacterium]
MDDQRPQTRTDSLDVHASKLKRVAYYGGSFDPVHRGHLEIAQGLLGQFALDKLVFIPAFHAPHKLRKKPTSAYDRYAMLCLATHHEPQIFVSRIEIEAPDRPFSIDTLTQLSSENPRGEIFFVMGADSWMDITTWREWRAVLSLTHHIVITRPGYEIGVEHVSADVRRRIRDLRSQNVQGASDSGILRSVRGTSGPTDDNKHIYFADLVNLEISATVIRQRVRENNPLWRRDVPLEVANYIEKYQIYN